MMLPLLTTTFRGFAFLLALSPLIINSIIKGDIVASLVYAPLLSLLLAIVLIYIDKKIQRFEQSLQGNIKAMFNVTKNKPLTNKGLNSTKAPLSQLTGIYSYLCEK